MSQFGEVVYLEIPLGKRGDEKIVRRRKVKRFESGLRIGGRMENVESDREWEMECFDGREKSRFWEFETDFKWDERKLWK